MARGINGTCKLDNFLFTPLSFAFENPLMKLLMFAPGMLFGQEFRGYQDNFKRSGGLSKEKARIKI